MRQGWANKKLGDIADIIMGQSPDGSSVNDTEGMEFHQGKVAFGEKYINPSGSYTTRPTKLAEGHSLLLSVRAPIGALNVTERTICIGRGLCAVRAKDQTSLEFLYYALCCKQDYFERNATGSTFKAISTVLVKGTPVLLPSIAEQQAIVAYLDNKTSKLDECVRLLELQKKDLADYRRAIISETVTRGLNPNTKLKDSGVEWVGQIPEDWAISRIKHCGDVFGRIGFRGYTVADMVSEGEGAITLSPSNIKDNKMSYDKLSYVSWAKYKESPEIQIHNGDILMTKTGSSYGKSAYVEGLPMEATINPQFIVIKNIRENAKYLAYVLTTSIIQQQVENVVVGGTIPTMAQKDINNFYLPLPPLSEQQAIVDYLDSKTSKLDEAIKRIDEQIADLRTYRTALISDVVTGKIDVRNN